MEFLSFARGAALALLLFVVGGHAFRPRQEVSRRMRLFSIFMLGVVVPLSDAFRKRKPR